LPSHPDTWSDIHQAASLQAAISLHFSFYDFCRPHATLKRATPAMAVGLTERKWGVEELATLAY
jgi:hypothetical protein